MASRNEGLDRNVDFILWSVVSFAPSSYSLIRQFN